MSAPSQYQLDDSEATPIAASQIDSTFAQCIDLISSRLPTRIISYSDQFFAPASSLNSPIPPISKPNTYVATGAWYDGWETRRHNPRPFDYVIFRLGVPAGVILGIEVDTAFFAGNHAPEISVEGCWCDDDETVKSWGFQRGGWEVVLGKQTCEGNTRHAWQLATPVQGRWGSGVTHVRLNNWPDGGIARIRVYGHVLPSSPTTVDEIVDLASIFNGGVAIRASNERYGTASNLLLPGRGTDISDGWETRRSRTTGHTDWAIVRLGTPGHVDRVVVDTACFIGNYPKAVKVMGVDWRGRAEEDLQEQDPNWRVLAEEGNMSADKEHDCTMSSTGADITHVMLVMIPDGGVKRLRVFGRRLLANEQDSSGYGGPHV